MGYDTHYTGEITITPPLTWGEVKGSPWLSDQYDDVTLRVETTITKTETDEGATTVTRTTAVAVTPVSDDAYKGYRILDHLQQIIDAFPGHTFSGYIAAQGEEAGDLWRLAVRDGCAVKIQPSIVWPDEEADQ